MTMSPNRRHSFIKVIIHTNMSTSSSYAVLSPPGYPNPRTGLYGIHGSEERDRPRSHANDHGPAGFEERWARSAEFPMGSPESANQTVAEVIILFFLKILAFISKINRFIAPRGL